MNKPCHDGVFPDCGCTYIEEPIQRRGIKFCPLHAAAPDLLAIIEGLAGNEYVRNLELMEGRPIGPILRRAIKKASAR